MAEYQGTGREAPERTGGNQRGRGKSRRTTVDGFSRLSQAPPAHFTSLLPGPPFRFSSTLQVCYPSLQLPIVTNYAHRATPTSIVAALRLDADHRTASRKPFFARGLQLVGDCRVQPEEEGKIKMRTPPPTDFSIELEIDGSKPGIRGLAASLSIAHLPRRVRLPRYFSKVHVASANATQMPTRRP